jgi:hypothetical protein
MHAGYCGRTWRSGNCTIDDKGSWSLTSLSACRSACLACPRCRYLSFSRTERDCSWYTECSLADLRRSPNSAPDYVTLALRSQIESTALANTSSSRPLDDSRPLRVAVATVSLGPFVPALVQWCESVARLRSAWPPHWRVQALILGGVAQLDVDHEHGRDHGHSTQHSTTDPSAFRRV